MIDSEQSDYRDSLVLFTDTQVRNILRKLRDDREKIERLIKWTVEEINDRKIDDYIDMPRENRD